MHDHYSRNFDFWEKTDKSHFKYPIKLETNGILCCYSNTLNIGSRKNKKNCFPFHYGFEKEYWVAIEAKQIKFFFTA